MMLRVRYSVALVLLVAATVLSSCIFPEYDPELFNDDEWIASQGDRYSYVHRTVESSPSALDIRFSGFYGKHSLWSLDASPCAVVRVAVDVAGDLRGRFKVCIIAPDKTVSVLASGSGLSTQAVKLQPGAGAIVIVGDGASGTASIRLDSEQSPAAVVIKEIR
jgi:hypothetical protein